MSHFNDSAATWDTPDKIQMMGILAKRTIEALQQQNALNRPLAIIDFGCGTGLFGLELADYATSLIGIDTSEGMLEVFAKKTAEDSQISALLLDLEQDCPELPKADLIVSSMAFHHLQDPQTVLGKLKSMLLPGGLIVIVDLDKEDGTFHPDNQQMGVRHFGFDQNTVAQWAQTNNLSMSHSIVHQIHKNDRTYPIFLATMKAPDSPLR